MVNHPSVVITEGGKEVFFFFLRNYILKIRERVTIMRGD